VQGGMENIPFLNFLCKTIGIKEMHVNIIKNEVMMGLLTGSAFPQGGAFKMKYLPCRKKPKALQKAHLSR
jgi:hypothetical protein